MKVITYRTKQDRTRTRGVKDCDLSSFAQNPDVTIIAVNDVDVTPGTGLSRFLAWVREKCGS